jgi:hypothetical protein
MTSLQHTSSGMSRTSLVTRIMVAGSKASGGTHGFHLAMLVPAECLLHSSAQLTGTT